MLDKEVTPFFSGYRGAILVSFKAMAVFVLFTLGVAPVKGLAQQSAVSVSIRSQPLERALEKLGEQAGLQIFYLPETVAGLVAPEVSGQLTADEALRRVLAGTGVQFHRTGNNVSLSRARAQPSAEATTLAPVIAAFTDELPAAYAGGQVATGGHTGLLGNQDFMNNPVSVASYTAQAIENQLPRTVGDFLSRNDSSVRTGSGDNSGIEYTQIRGFNYTAGSDYSLNGLPGVVSQYRSAPEFIERAEVLKGPSAMLGGMAPSGGSGGAVNLVTKRAQDEALTRLTTSYLSDSRIGLHADVGRRFGQNKEWGIRVNGAWREGKTARENQRENRWLGAVALDYRSDRLRFSIDAIQQESRQRSSRGMLTNIGAVGVLPEAPKGTHNLDQPWGMSTNSDKTIMSRVEYDITPGLSAWLSVGRAKSRYGGADSFGGNIELVNAAGDIRHTRVGHGGWFDMETVSVDTGLRGEFETGPVLHKWVVNFSTLRRVSGYTIGSGESATGFYSNIYDPIYYPAPDLAPPAGLTSKSILKLPSVALADTLSLAEDRVQLTLGVRRQQVDSRSYDAVTDVKTSSYKKSATTPFVGLIVKPWDNLSLYANYIEGLTQGATAPANAVNAGELFAPYKTKQYEIGVKYDSGTLAATVGLFQITRPSASLGTGNVFAMNGEQRNRGLEFSFFGEVQRGLRVLGGAMLLDAKLTRTPTGLNEGNRAIGTSKLYANLGVEWDVRAVPGMTLTAGAVHTGSSYLDNENRARAPSWTRADVGLRYATKVSGKPIVLRATVENVFNKAYWAANTYGYADLGASRTFLLSATMDF